MKQVHKASAIPLYGVAALWVIYALLLPLYRLWHFLIPVALSVVVYMVLKKRFPGKKLYRPGAGTHDRRRRCRCRHPAGQGGHCQAPCPQYQD